VIIGFTGTQLGLTMPQQWLLEAWLGPRADKIVEFHHGDCVGADELAHQIAQRAGIKVFVHPPVIETKRAFCAGAEHVYPQKPYLDRNHDIVDACTGLIACPFELEEQVRSGTWATVRYARKRGKPVRLIMPDASSMLIK
jgi:hypothetical protein